MSKKLTYTIGSDLRHMKSHLASLAEELGHIIEVDEGGGSSSCPTGSGVSILARMNRDILKLREQMGNLWEWATGADLSDAMGQLAQPVAAPHTTNWHGKTPYSKE